MNIAVSACRSSPQLHSLALLDPENPALDVSHFLLLRRERGSEKPRERPVQVRAAHPFRSGIGVVLVVVTILLRKASPPKRWIDFCYD